VLLARVQVKAAVGHDETSGEGDEEGKEEAQPVHHQREIGVENRDPGKRVCEGGSVEYVGEQRKQR
jgi:hypothetical protein